MRIEELKNNRVNDFIKYCKKHRAELDDSFLYEEDLQSFEPTVENPTYIVLNEQDGIVGTVSLIMDEYHRSGNKARFRIFHTEIESFEVYTLLMNAIMLHTKELEKVFLFVPFENRKLSEVMEGLKFNIERYTFVLVREDREVPKFHLPNGYEIKKLQPGNEETWCAVRNSSFAKLKGSETPITPGMVKKMMSDDDHIEGGAMILYHGDKAVGVIRGTVDEYENAPIMNIGPIAIIPEYQGQGLGRVLLRASLHFAKEKNYKRTILCVNADNNHAKALYVQEGFEQVEAVTCYKYDIHSTDVEI
ncbi:GNAT family N-acetyltransferase [Bacillus sp. FJAT-22090]|uniref:GNAT family N-acetyltransferase n=1 Tax=Bacillus sp. FJAT-22090 TaxID=1581038 RepID=UPI0006AF9044|nr:GNAT family N-acetyltransferase [Bacillus sp. FJAT-22090]